MRKLTTIILLTVANGLGWHALAQEPALESEPLVVPDRYQVELVFFAFERQTGNNGEDFNPPALLADRDSGGTGAIEEQAVAVYSDRPIEAESGAEPEAIEAEALPEEPVLEEIDLFKFRLVEPGQLALAEIFKRLGNAKAYRPLLHAAWIQNSQPQEEAHAFNLDRVSAPPALRGEVILYEGNFLHLDFNVEYVPEALAPGPGIYYDDRRTEGFGSFYPFDRPPTRYTLAEQRKIRRDEQHYFDHPFFGVIATVSLIEAPEPELEDEDQAIIDE